MVVIEVKPHTVINMMLVDLRYVNYLIPYKVAHNALHHTKSSLIAVYTGTSP